MPTVASAAESSTKGRAAWLVVTGVLLFLFLALAAVGDRQAEGGTRVLAQLDGIYAALFGAGNRFYAWVNLNVPLLAYCVSSLAGAVVVLALIARGWSAGPVVCLAAAICLATWAQAELLADHVEAGIVLYGLGIACALLLGIWKPFVATEGDAGTTPPASRSVDIAAVFVFTVFAIVTRLYALNELPNAFDVEIVDVTLQSLTLHGIREWAAVGFFSNSAGIAHFFPQWLMSQLFGASLYSVRLAAVFTGVVTVPIFYVLVRRFAGTWAAIFGTLLFVTSPEQLYWSRLETTVYIPLSALSLTTVLLGFSLIERATPGNPVRLLAVGAATAMCMGIARVFYQAGIVMFVHPVLLCGHALTFGTSARRLVRRAVPFLVLGVALWISSISMMRATAGGAPTLVNPFIISGEAPWSKQGQFDAATPLELVRLQCISIGTNLSRFVGSMSYRAGFSRWYDRGDRSSHPTVTNVAFFACLALGLGYLLGQLRDLRAWALLTWIGLGLMPGALSIDPDARRVALIFPALPIVVTLFATAAVRLVRTHGGRLAGTVAVIAALVLGTLIGLTNVVSYFLLPSGPIELERFIAAARPVFDDSDVVLHDLPEDAVTPLVLGNLEVFTERTPPLCTDPVLAQGSMSAALRPRCDYSSFVNRITISPAQIEAAKQHFEPKKLTYLLTLAESSRAMRDLLRQIYPEAMRRTFEGAFAAFSFEAVTVSSADVEATHKPIIRAPTNAPQHEQILASGTAYTFVSDSSGETAAGTVIEGGFVMEKDSWWSIALAPSCPGAVVQVDDASQAADDLRPLHAGAHTFSIRVPNLSKCKLPLHLAANAPQQPERDLLSPGSVVAPDVAARLREGALPVGLFAGYRKVEDITVAPVVGDPLDFGVGRGNTLIVAVSTPEGVALRRIGPDRALDETWGVPLPPKFGFQSLETAADGGIAAFGTAQVMVYDAAGKNTSAWPYPPATLARGVFDPAGALLLSWPQEGAVLRLNRDGTVEQKWYSLPGGPQRFDLPMAAACGPSGNLAIMQNNGRVFRYRRSPETAELELAATFQTAIEDRVHAFALGDDDRLFVQTTDRGVIQVYAPDGRRLLASDPNLDLGVTVRDARRFQDTVDGLFVLGEGGVISIFKPS